MKKVTKFFIAALLAGMSSFGYAQLRPDYMLPPKSNEKVLGIITERSYETAKDYTDLELYSQLLKKAKELYPNSTIDIREMGKEKHTDMKNDYWYDGRNHPYTVTWYNLTGKVVDLHDPKAQTMGNISQALNKALRNVREGSRMAIDQVSVTSDIDRETLKDQLIDVLLEKGYRVVAKDYLDKLYEEQQDQQSGIYNEGTTVQENNFSAVGYYINVKVTETSLRVQVVNVSTGEYEGNATVNF